MRLACLLVMGSADKKSKYQGHSKCLFVCVCVCSHACVWVRIGGVSVGVDASMLCYNNVDVIHESHFYTCKVSDQ